MAKRSYQNNLPSVTAIISLLNNHGLNEWFKRTPYHEIIEESNRAKRIGGEIHQAIEDYIITGQAKISTENPIEVTNALKSFMLFRKEHSDIPLKLAETPLTDTILGYNGTIDCPCPPVLLDWKSAKCGDKEKPPIYDSYKTQAATYVHLWNHNHPWNHIDKALIVAVAKDKEAYNVCEMTMAEIDYEFNEVFLPLLKIWRYKNYEKISLQK